MSHRRKKQRARLLGAILWTVVVIVVVAVAESRGWLPRAEGSLPSGRASAQQPSTSTKRERRQRRADPAPRSSSGKAIDGSIHVGLGVPTDADPSDDYLLDEGAYVASYNPEKRVANWVSWSLERAHLGRVPRRNQFRPNPVLPASYYRVTPADYQRSGFDRGHLCPSADRTDSRENNAATFLMTNIQPQFHELNAGPWEKLEEHARELARRPAARLFIVAGGLFSESPDTIGHGVAVPKACYKIIVVSDLDRPAPNLKLDSRVLAVIMPNSQGVAGRNWTDYVTSVDEIERQSGYDFLNRVPERVQRVIEAAVASGT